MVNAVMSRSLSMIPLNINDTEVDSALSVVSQCMHVSCNSSNITELVNAPPPAPAPPPPTESGTEILHMHYLMLYINAFAVILLMNYR